MRWRFARSVVVHAVTAVLISSGLAGSVTSQARGSIVGADSPTAVAEQYIVDLDAGLEVEEVARDLVHRHGGRIGYVYTAVLGGFSLTASPSQAAAIAGDPRVNYVAADQWGGLADSQDGLLQPGQNWGLDRIDQRLGLNDTYRYALSNVWVYIVDSGVRLDHREFGGRASTLWSVDGQDFCAGAKGIHGTQVAGIVGGATFGVAKHATIRNVKVGRCGSGDEMPLLEDDDIIAGLDAIVRDRARTGPAVVNLSFALTRPGTAMDEAVKGVVRAGVTVVAAAGNFGADACSFTPGRVAEVITVAAVNRDDTRLSDSNLGGCTDLFAPGGDITSASSTGATATCAGSGTSFAAPHVAGAAAVLLAENPGLTPRQVADLIVANATPHIVEPPDVEPNRLLYLSAPGARDAGAQPATDLNAMWNAYGDQGNHWTGGDEAASVRLPDGRIAWLFSDTFLGTVNADHSRPLTSPMIHNSLVVQSGTVLGPTLTAGTAAAPKSLVGSETDDVPGDAGYWVNDGSVIGNELVVFYTHYRKAGEGPLGVEQTGTAIARFSLPGLTLRDKVDLAVGTRVKWGTALLEDQGNTYIYGVETAGEQKLLRVARVPTAQLRDTSAWRYWTGDRAEPWATQEAQATTVTTGVSDGFSMERVGGRYVLVTYDNHLVFGPNIIALFSASPTGPFTEQTHLYRSPESAGNHIVYDPRVHPELSHGSELVISYNVNSLDAADNYTDVRIYRPRFINVTLPAAVGTPAVPEAPKALDAQPSADGIRLRWTAPPGGVSHYWVYQRDVTAPMNQARYARLPDPVQGTTIDLRYLTGGHTYEYRVAAVSAGVEGPKSLPARALVAVTPPTHAPGNLVATARPDGTIDLSWQPVPEAGVFYRVLQRDVTAGQTEFTRWPTPINGRTHATAIWLQQDHRYEFGVLALNAGGDGPVSNIASAVSHMQPPGAPTNLRATPGDAQVRLDWTAPAPDLWYFPFIRNVSAGETAFTKLPIPLTSGTTFTYHALINKQEYEFKVVASSAGGEGPESSVVRATPQPTTPPPPSGLVATPQGDGSIALSWQTPREGSWFSVYQRDITDNPNAPFTRWQLPVTDGPRATAKYLAHGHTYEFKVVTTYYDLESTPTNAVRATARYNVPPAPTGLRVIATNDGNAELTWDRLAADPWYWVYQRDVTAGEAFWRWGLPSQEPRAFASPLISGHRYEFKISGTNAGGEGPAGAVVSVVAGGGTPPAPGGLTATPGDGRVVLNWTSVGPDSWYVVEYRNVTAGQPFQRVATLNSNTTWNHTLLNNGDIYEYRVRGSNAHGEGAASPPVRARPLPPLPPAVTGLVATPGDGLVRLRWNAAAPAGVWYVVEHRDATAGQPFQRIQTLSANTTWTHTLLHNGHTYEYRVRANNVAGDGPPSAVVGARPMPPLPPAPTGLTVTGVGEHSVGLSWNAPAPNLWYRLYLRDATVHQNFYELGVPITTNSFTAAHLVPGHRYEFFVRSLNVTGESGSSNTVSATPIEARCDVVAGDPHLYEAWPGTPPLVRAINHTACAGPVYDVQVKIEMFVYYAFEWIYDGPVTTEFWGSVPVFRSGTSELWSLRMADWCVGYMGMATTTWRTSDGRSHIQIRYSRPVWLTDEGPC